MTTTPLVLTPSHTALAQAGASAHASAISSRTVSEAALLGGLGPEEILLACRNRVGDLDRQVRDVVHQMQDRQHIGEQLGALASALRETDEHGDLTQQGYDDACAAMEQISDWELQAQLQQELGGYYGSGNHVSKSELESFTREVSDRMGALNSGTELLQIQLQQLMNQRQQAVQLATNMLQSLHQTAMAPIQNLHA